MSKQKQIKTFSILLTVLAMLFYVSSQSSSVKAGTCSFTPDATGVASITTSCNIPTDSTVYVDYASTEGSTSNTAIVQVGNSTLTISPGNTKTTSLYTGSLKIAAGGSVVIGTASQMKVGSATAYYMTDADADGWPGSLSFYTATASGRRRASLMRSTTVPDCNDAVYNVANNCLKDNGVACSADAECTSGVCGTNADSDGYFSLAAGHTGVCMASALPYTDCYDVNSTGGANTYPGQTAYFTGSRGDGSFDYNCDGSATKSNDTFTQGSCQTCAYTTQVKDVTSSSGTASCGGNYSVNMIHEAYSGNTCYTTTCGSLMYTYTATTSCH